MAKKTRRQFLKSVSGSLLFTLIPLGIKAQDKSSSSIIAVRIWPASSYTRVTLESTVALKYDYFHLKDPQRLVIDLYQVSLNQVIETISSKVLENDPYIDKARVGQFNETTVRIVFDLKRKVNPQVFTLSPVSQFKNRLVIDLYSAEAFKAEDDPLLALLQDYNKGEISNDGTLKNKPVPQVVATEKDILSDKIEAILNKSKPETIKPEKQVGIKKPTQDPVYEVPKAKKSNGRKIVMLDPGHGGEDPGAIGKTGLREKDIVLSIARTAKKKLEAMGYKVHMTRNEDVFIPLSVRVAKARQLKANIFISIHADAFTKPTARGTGVYALSAKGATSAAAKYLAQTQNQSDAIGGVKKVGNKNVDNTIFDLYQTETINRGLKLGSLVLKELEKINKLHKNYVDQAGFAVLKAPDIPSILVETAFISNPTEESLLSSTSFRNSCATAISTGAHKYLNSIK